MTEKENNSCDDQDTNTFAAANQMHVFKKLWDSIEFFHLIQKKFSRYFFLSFFVQMFSVIESTFKIESFNSKILKVYTLE